MSNSSRYAVRSFNLSAASYDIIARLVNTARADQTVAAALSLSASSRPRRGSGGRYHLSTAEIDELAAVMKRPDLRTESAVYKAMSPFSDVDQVLSSEAVELHSEIIRRPVTTGTGVNASRVLDVLIAKGAAVIESEIAGRTASVNDGQIGHKSFNGKARKANAASSVHRAGRRKP